MSRDLSHAVSCARSAQMLRVKDLQIFCSIVLYLIDLVLICTLQPKRPLWKGSYL